jgi:hypothetical protein
MKLDKKYIVLYLNVLIPQPGFKKLLQNNNQQEKKLRK